ncbi:MAG: nucleotide exchange factor GrpE [Actinomycetota bacterium]
MTDANPADQPVDPESVDPEESEPTGPRVTDNRRLDPETGKVRDASFWSGAAPADAVAGDAADESLEVLEPEVVADGEDVDQVVEGDDVHPDTTLAADLTRDLQRLQAEYVNYKKRVDRDREMHRDLAVANVVESLLPVLDDIHLARQHGDLEGGPFSAIADKLDAIVSKIGVERYGQPGDAFDPNVHEALMHVEAELAEGTEGTTVVQVLQPGYRMGQRIIRAARVAVADPQT